MPFVIFDWNVVLSNNLCLGHTIIIYFKIAQLITEVKHNVCNIWFENLLKIDSQVLHGLIPNNIWLDLSWPCLLGVSFDLALCGDHLIWFQLFVLVICHSPLKKLLSRWHFDVSTVLKKLFWAFKSMNRLLWPSL